MTTPLHSTTAANGSRLYTHPTTGQQVPSVTTILSVLDKPALPRWAALETATYAVENMESWKGLPPRDAVDLLKKAPWSKSKSAADAGTDAHSVFEAMLLGRDLPPIATDLFAPLHGKAIDNVRAMVDAIKPVPVAVEALAWNADYEYAGTFDALLLVEGVLTLVDLKTSKDVYPDYALQLAAYKHATHIILPDGTETPMPAIQRCQIWHAPKEGTWKAVDIRVGDDEFAAFVAARELHRWKADHAPGVIDKPKRTRKA